MGNRSIDSCPQFTLGGVKIRLVLQYPYLGIILVDSLNDADCTIHRFIVSL
jgi:hypothetical protein